MCLFPGNNFRKDKTASITGLRVKNVPKSIQKCAVEKVKIKRQKLKGSFFVCVIVARVCVKSCMEEGFRCHKGRME